jgi:hypothetical protein
MSFAQSGSKQFIIRQKNNTSNTVEATRMDLTAYSGSETFSPLSKGAYLQGRSPRIIEKDTPRMLLQHRPESKVSMTEFSKGQSTSISTRLYKPPKAGPKNYLRSDPTQNETQKLLNDFESRDS